MNLLRLGEAVASVRSSECKEQCGAPPFNQLTRQCGHASLLLPRATCMLGITAALPREELPSVATLWPACLANRAPRSSAIHIRTSDGQRFGCNGSHRNSQRSDMRYISFADVKSAFADEAGIREFRCIGIKRKTQCTNALVDDRKDIVRKLLHVDIVDLEEVKRLSIVLYLLCAACQRTDTQRNNVKQAWSQENAGLSFGSKGLRSPASLRPHRSPKYASTSRTRRKAGLSTQSCPGLTIREGHHYQDTPASPSEERARRRRRAFEASGPPPETTTSEQPRRPPSNPAQLVSKPPGERVLQFSETMHFRRGKGWQRAPWKLRSNLLDKLFEPIPSGTGFVYAVSVTGTRFVKIGKTITSTQGRFDQVCKEHRIDLDEASARWSDRIPRWQVDRLEKVVHCRLAFQQVELVDEEANRKVHHEYFEVDLDYAKQCIDQCLWIMRSIDVNPGRQIDQNIQQNMREYINGIDKPPRDVNSKDRQWWHDVNSNQQRETAIWHEASKYHLGGYQRLLRLEEVKVAIGIAISLLVPFLLPVPRTISAGVSLNLIMAWILWMAIEKHGASWYIEKLWAFGMNAVL